MHEQQPPSDPREIIRTFRGSYVNFHRLWRATGRLPPGVEMYSPAERPIVDDELPPELQTVIGEYRKRHPEREIEYLKFMRTVDGHATLIIEDERDLPGEDELLTISQTVTVAAHNHVRVVSDLLVARAAS